MDLRSIFVANGIGIFILLMQHFASRAKVLRDRAEDRLYSLMVLGVMLGCFMEAFSYALDGRLFPGARILNYIANTYLFSVNLLLPFCVLVYVELVLYGDPSRIRKRYKPQIVIGAVFLFLNLVNLFLPVTYYISPQNVYERRPLGYVYYFVILYYCLTSILVTRRFEKENGARAFLSIQLFMLPILVGAAVQFLFYGLSLAWVSAAVGLVGLYMMQQNEVAYIDPLVDTYNRQYLNHILSSWTNHEKTFAGVMLDVDRFKRINDSCGHSEGDRVLKDVTGILKRSRRENEWVFRFAGDEFIVLKLTDREDGLAAYMDEVARQLAEYNRGDRPYQLSLSYGMSFFRTGEPDRFMKEMDARMYEMKAKHHAAEREG